MAAIKSKPLYLSHNHHIKSFEINMIMVKSFSQFDSRRNLYCRSCGEAYDASFVKPVRIKCGHSICIICMADYRSTDSKYTCEACLPKVSIDFNVFAPKVNEPLVQLVRDIRENEFLRYSMFNEITTDANSDLLDLNYLPQANSLQLLCDNLDDKMKGLFKAGEDTVNKIDETTDEDLLKKQESQLINEIKLNFENLDACNVSGSLEKLIQKIAPLENSMKNILMNAKSKTPENAGKDDFLHMFKNGYEICLKFQDLVKELKRNFCIYVSSWDVDTRRWTVMEIEELGIHMKCFELENANNKRNFFYEMDYLISIPSFHVSHIYFDLQGTAFMPNSKSTTKLSKSETLNECCRIYITPADTCYAHHFMELAIGRYGMRFKNLNLELNENHIFSDGYNYDKKSNFLRSLLYTSPHSKSEMVTETVGLVSCCGSQMDKGLFKIRIKDEGETKELQNHIGYVTSGIDFLKKIESAFIKDCGIVLQED